MKRDRAARWPLRPARLSAFGTASFSNKFAGRSHKSELSQGCVTFHALTDSGALFVAGDR